MLYFDRANTPIVQMFSQLVKMPFLNIKDYNEIDLIQLIHIMLITVSLLNARSLRYQQSQTSYRKWYPMFDRSQNKNDNNATEVLEQLSCFKIYFNSSGQRHQNLAICLRENTTLLNHMILFQAYQLLILQKTSPSYDIIRLC